MLIAFFDRLVLLISLPITEKVTRTGLSLVEGLVNFIFVFCQTGRWQFFLSKENLAFDIELQKPKYRYKIQRND